MEGYSYLGEEIVEDSPYKNYSKNEFAMLFITMYSGVDGSHHKDWLIDQIARILKGTEVIIKLAKWSNGYKEYRFTLGTPSPAYLDFVKEMKAGEDGDDTYSYEVGIAP